MKNPILELVEKRKRQYNNARRMMENLEHLKNMSDDTLRFNNMARGNYILNIIVKEGISFGEAYSFACEHNKETGENALNEPVNENHTLLWSGSSLEKHIRERKMTSSQYSCFEMVVDMMNSKKFDNYWAIKNLRK